jgi:hypothetical protein
MIPHTDLGMAVGGIHDAYNLRPPFCDVDVDPKFQTKPKDIQWLSLFLQEFVPQLYISSAPLRARIDSLRLT